MKRKLVSILLLGSLFTFKTVFSQTVTSGREPVYHAEPTRSTRLIHTKLKVNFDFGKQQMNGEEWLTAAPYFYPTDSLVLNAKYMLINSVAMDDNGVKKPLKYEYKNNILKINLGKTYSKDEKYQVYINYVARPNNVAQGGGNPAISDDKGLYFINPLGKDPNKPTQIWTQGETEANSVWFPTIDKPNQKSTEEIYMTVPDKYVTLSNGILTDSQKESNGMRTDHWVMDKKHAPYLFFLGVGDFAVVKDKWRNIPVNYYVEKEYEPYAKEIFGETPEMMEYFSKLLNYDYPWSKYDQMAVRDYVSGAMENTTAVVHGERVQQKPGDLIDENRWETTIAHELFHHWFGDLVTAESWSNLTVNESFANYSEYLWLEHKYDKDYADYHLMENANRYLNNPMDFTKDLVRFNYKREGNMFDLVSYNKGGAILNMLRHYLGDKAFFEGLHQYLVENAYGTGEAHELRLALEEISGKDLNWFFNQWYYGSGNPVIETRQSYDPVKKEVTVTIAQSGPALFQFPLAIDLYIGNEVKRENVWVNAKSSNSFSFSADKKPQLVNINADGVLLATISDERTPEQCYLQYTKSKELLSRYTALEEAVRQIDNPIALKTVSTAFKDPFFRIRILALNSLDLSKSEHKKEALSMVEKLASSDPKTLVQAAAIKALSKTGDKKYIPLYEKGISALSNAVKTSCLLALQASDPQRVTEIADKIDLSNASEDTISSLLPTIVNNKLINQMPYIGQIVAFYPFIYFQDAKKGSIAEKGFQWIMDSDNTAAVESVTKILFLAKQEMDNSPQAKMVIIQMLEDGVKRKMQLLKTTSNKDSVNKQINLLNIVIESYKK